MVGIKPEELKERLAAKSVLVVGAGGLGGYVIEHLARAGVGKITIMDGDVFTESNMNRQLYCTKDTLGKGKAEVAAARVAEISDGEGIAVNAFFSEKTTATASLADAVVDCLDNVKGRLILEEACSRYGKILVHGAISGLSGQVAAVEPNSGFLKKLYSAKSEPVLTTVSVCPAAVAALQATLAIKILLGEPVGKGLTVINLDPAELAVINQK